MSLNRENVTWQSKDGKWNRGFFAFYTTGEDFEWDVEYHDYFNWVSLGHATEEQAHDSWDGANPGHTFVSRFNPVDSKSVEQAERYDALAKQFLESKRVKR